MMSHNGTASVYRSIGWTLRGGIDRSLQKREQSQPGITKWICTVRYIMANTKSIFMNSLGRVVHT